MAKKIEMSGLDWICANLEEQPRKPDEFTCEDIYQERKNQGADVTRDATRHQLNRLVDAGKLKSRKARHQGRVVVLYSKS